MKNRIIAGALAFTMVLCLMLASVPVGFTQGDTVNISSTGDFIAFSKKCTLDSWSQGKTVNLNCDLDFSGTDFSPVPTFGGTFNGNGYTVSGIEYSKKGSYSGLFRYIQQGGKVSNLNVIGSFSANGSKSYIGGIAGENSGTIEFCTFNGIVKGENVIGGIAGHNNESGRIISCTPSGSVSGENSTGGVAGKNSGFIQDCTNNAAVNTVYEEKKKDISDIDTDVGAIIENRKNAAEETEEESVLGHSDTGGISGYSSGIIQGCTNNAAVGYKHIGYNVGGIAGRQSGYMLGCTNYGFIQGRKDVGGIAGQAEPYILLDPSEATLGDIRRELDSLSSLINKFITDADGLGSDSETYLDNISKYSKSARENMETIVNEVSDFADANIDEINAKSAILSNTFDKLTPALDSLESAGENLADSLSAISDSIENLKESGLNDELKRISSALATMAKAERSIKKAYSSFQNAKADLNSAIKLNDREQIVKAVSDLSAAIDDIIAAKKTISSSLEEIANILGGGNGTDIAANAEEIVKNLKIIIENTNVTIKSLQTVKDSLNIIISGTEIDFSKFKSAAENMNSALRYMNDAMYYITSGLRSMSIALGNIADMLDESNLNDSIKLLSYAAEDITDAIGSIRDIVSDLADEEPIKFVKLSDSYKTASENLFGSLSDMSGEMDKLRNLLSDNRGKMSDNLTAINNKFNLVMNLMLGEIESLSGKDGISDIFLDVSDEDIESAKQGKIAECHNFGGVEGDKNAGGIAGAMAIEYSKDPEDDLEKPDSLSFVYRTRAVLQACINDGNVTGKKDCIGGIAGLAEVGTVYECENYSDAESTGGNYVGGIAGKSDSAVRKCYSKGSHSGKRYVGGVAGKGTTVTASYAIADVSGDENTGSVCGGVQDAEKLYLNFFVDGKTGAVDGISYKGKAEPISFETLKNTPNIPARFISFSVTFTADGKTVGTQQIKYGDDTAKIKYPKIPEKKGHFGTWPEPKEKTVTQDIKIVCEYKPYVTVLSSEEKNESGKLALALAEGEFTDKAELHISESSENPPEREIGRIKVYDVSLKNTDIKEDGETAIRVLNENKDKVTAWILKDGKWKKTDVSKRGKYVIMQTKGTDNTICLKYEKRNFVFLKIFIPLILIAAAVCGGMLLKRRKKRV